MPLWCLHSSQSDERLSDDITMQEAHISTRSPNRSTEGNWYRSSVRSLLNGLPSWKKAKVRVFMSSMEIVHDGWLIKSPPEKKIWKAKWRRRWFVLRHSGQLPGQFLLEYYTDSSRKKLKGKIDLDQCEQIDAGLTFECRKYHYQYMFDLKTPKRTYFLVAETQQDMNKWVDCICSVCGLKKESPDESESPQPEESSQNILTSQNQPATRTSLTEGFNTGQQLPIEIVDGEASPSIGPSYIELEKCFSGSSSLANGVLRRCDSIPDSAPPPPPKSNRDSNSSLYYDTPRSHNVDIGSPVNAEVDDMYQTLPLPSSNTDSFCENEWNRPPSSADWGMKLFPSKSSESLNSNKELKRSSSDCESYDVVPIHPLERFRDRISPVVMDKIVNDLSSVHVGSNTKRSMSLTHQTIQMPNMRKISQPELTLSSLPPPPRPPKPPAVDPEERNYINLSPFSGFPQYDIPAAVRGIYPNNSGQCFLFGKNSSLEITSDSTVPPPLQTLTDDIYDFPKSFGVDSAMPNNSSQKKHSYCNAPIGYPVSDNTYMDMRRPEEILAVLEGKNTSIYTDMSGTSSTAPPPMVNRKLKPEKKKSLVSSKGSNGIRLPTSPRRMGPPVEDSFVSYNKSPKWIENSGANSNIPLPRRIKSHMSSSEDEQDSNSPGSRNSDIDGIPSQNTLTKPKKETIEYLDLDLESEVYNQSPKTKSPDRFPSNSGTVYKTVDFVKTDAFNRTRHTMENYRKSQTSSSCQK